MEIISNRVCLRSCVGMYVLWILLFPDMCQRGDATRRKRDLTFNKLHHFFLGQLNRHQHQMFIWQKLIMSYSCTELFYVFMKFNIKWMDTMHELSILHHNQVLPLGDGNRMASHYDIWHNKSLNLILIHFEGFTSSEVDCLREKKRKKSLFCRVLFALSRKLHV